ncbi:MAG: hypothetical protein K2H57_11500 [Duncaniella sp.]|nr:hypothetical protein [Duncaniella sp.]
MTTILRHIIFSGLAGLMTLSASAITTEEVNKAVNLAREAPRNKVFNRKAGDALKEAGRFKEAITYYLKGDNAANLGAAESYFYLYEFDKAGEYLDKYLEKRTKAEAAKDKNFISGDGGEPVDWTDNLRSRIDLGRAMLDRVEKIEIIDSINVPSDNFFKFFKLAKSAGRISDETALDKVVSAETLRELGVMSLWSPVFISESGEDLIWYGSSESGDSKMFESTRLADGSWDKPTPLFDYADMFGDKDGSWVAYPFLMSDGVTLYFAADGDNSLGELDIFISRRDSDGFLQPSNVGMPYNSPYNDYLYAIDEENKVGWWATDRNQLQDSVTIYTFIPQELRVNYPTDTPELTDYARVSSIAMTQNGETDYAAIKKRIKDSSTESEATEKSNFIFGLPGGKVITSMSQLSNQRAVAAMRQYLAEKDAYDKMAESLAKMRQAYANRDKSVGNRILSTEKAMEEKRAELLRLKNRVVTLNQQR